MASYHGNMEEIKALVEGGAMVTVVGEKGVTPLHEAASQGHTEAVKFLLQNGALLDVKDEFGRTPLDIAQVRGYSDIVKLLANQGNKRINEITIQPQADTQLILQISIKALRTIRIG